MGSSQWEGPRIGEDVPIECIQPGGGFCFGLEQRWGVVRRAYLGRFRRGYVERMHAKRQGSCPDCNHEIIDGRDLKLVRNVCGLRFAPEDDAFAWREKLGLARSGLAESLVACFVAAIAVAAVVLLSARLAEPLYNVALVPILYLWFHAIRFFRDPERKTPTAANALISPSDGVITDLHEIEDADFPGGRAFRVSIYLSPWDVHLNRNPMTAQVETVRYFPGRFLNARHKNCAIQNEQLWVDLHDGSRTIRIKQISGAMARRLVCWLRPGEKIIAGERYGMIKYGSRADVLIPADDEFKICVDVGDRVYAGESVIIEFSKEGEQS